MTPPRSAYHGLSQSQLATLVPELLLSGQLIDRSGMAHLISAFGREVMGQIAIDEWMAASPVYTSRMRSALQIDGDGVEDMFKCLQLDIGAPPQFMDFRYTVEDEYHGSFILAHCGALMDVEPMGDDYVTTMCHDIEDPTFDATAIATNRRARIRPVHRPPRVPADRTPHCEWAVSIEPDRAELPMPEDTLAMFDTRAGTIELSSIGQDALDGLVDYRGPLVADLQFREWSHSALTRIAEEVALQHQLLSLGFLWSVRRHGEEHVVRDIYRKQLTGIAGLAAQRLRSCLHLPGDATGLATVINLHPCFGPVQYTGITAERRGDDVVVRVPTDSPAVEDGGWITLLDAEQVAPLQSAAIGVDPHWTVAGGQLVDGALQFTMHRDGQEHKEFDEVAIVRFSSGASFEMTDRGRSIPITPLGNTV